jgi:hypothetical protein
MSEINESRGNEHDYGIFIEVTKCFMSTEMKASDTVLSES